MENHNIVPSILKVVANQTLDISEDLTVIPTKSISQLIEESNDQEKTQIIPQNSG